MRVWKGVFLSIMLTVAVVPAQPVEWFGYYEPQVNVVWMEGHETILMSNKLRVDLAKHLSERVRVAANFDYITYHGKTRWNLLDYLPDSIVRTLPPDLHPLFAFHFGDMLQPMGPAYRVRPDRIFLDNANVQLSFDRMDLTIGRQQISVGTGYAWNPTDLFNTKDVLDPTYEQPGRNALRAYIPLGGDTRLDVIFSPGEDWFGSVKQINIRTWIGHFDLSGVAAQTVVHMTDFPSFTPASYHRSLIGADFAGEWLGLGIWGEGAYNRMKHLSGNPIAEIDSFWEAIIGVDYTFENGVYGMIEGYHNSMLASNWRDYTLNHWMWYFESTWKSISRDQISALVTIPATDLMTVGVMALGSLSDGSVAVVPTLLLSLFEDVQLSVYGNLYLGQGGRVYSSTLGNGGLARLRVYF